MHPMLAGLALPGFGAQVTGQMGLLPHISVSIALMIDGFGEGEEGGTVTLRPDGAPQLDYPQGPRHFECFRASMKALAQAHLANGALRLSSLHVPPVTVTSEKDFPALEAAPLGPNRCGVFTAHQMGGCRMGNDPARSVVNPELRHHFVENLWVADASIIPTVTHANTNLTSIMIGERASDFINAAGA